MPPCPASVEPASAIPASEGPASDAAPASAGPASVGPASEGPTSDKIADLLLDDDGAPAAPADASTLDTAESVPEGSTIMELPPTGKPGSKPTHKTVLGSGNTSSAAAEILRKYQRRPRG